ncbi:hypothetical protein DMC30DRAFT_389517 [Rhodotorula diobovata]|uniref:Ubiquitin-like domain-containing protein n=1 Tax=Rhodotorula diobovata TaxID=5288 RepID=A0A5C5G2S6_9BASI|nr:hypothetical protein DMC30DRAFT_389517 [Rhodotorula diobovata]
MLPQEPCLAHAASAPVTPLVPPPAPSPPPAGKYDAVVSFKEGNKSITVWLNYDQEAQSPTSGEVSVGRYGGKIVVQANPNDTVRKLKEAISEIKGVPLEEQRLIFNGVRLSNSSRLESCGIVDGSDIFIARRGGGSVIGGCPGGCSQGCPSR